MTKPVYAFQILPTVLYDTPRIQVTIVRVEENGDIRNPGYDYGIDDEHFNDFHVSAYARDNGTLDGFSADYREAFCVDLSRAEKMVKHLRKVDRAMRKITTDEGYAEDFATYVLRVARVLGIKTFFIRNTHDQRFTSGDAWRKVDGYGVQHYIGDLAKRNGNFLAFDN